MKIKDIVVKDCINLVGAALLTKLATLVMPEMIAVILAWISITVARMIIYRYSDADESYFMRGFNCNAIGIALTVIITVLTNN